MLWSLSDSGWSPTKKRRFALRPLYVHDVTVTCLQNWDRLFCRVSWGQVRNWERLSFLQGKFSGWRNYFQTPSYHGATGKTKDSWPFVHCFIHSCPFWQLFCFFKDTFIVLYNFVGKYQQALQLLLFSGVDLILFCNWPFISVSRTFFMVALLKTFIGSLHT